MNSGQDGNRRFVLPGLVLLAVLVFAARLLSLQVINTQYGDSANKNALLTRPVIPPRGVIFDRNGRMVVNNQTLYDVTVTTKQLRDIDTLRLCSLLNIDQEYYRERMAYIKDRKRNPGYSPFTGQVFLSQLTLQEISPFCEKIYLFPGFDVERRTSRHYNYPVAAHLLGDIGEVSKSEIDADGYYVQGDYIGKQGVEKQYETYLRGKKGEEVLLKDAVGRIQGSYMNGIYDSAPEPGSNISLSIDIELQALGERLMKGKIGSIVAIEPTTGEVLCMVSAPTFEPQNLVGRIRSQRYAELSELWSKPLINRAIGGTYPPGSTFKAAQALVLLQEDIITTQTQFPCTGGFVHAGLRVGCHSHSSPLELQNAIATSCNGYFCWGFYRMIGATKYSTPQNALTVWKDYMVSQGFGYALGIDLPGEKRGMIPNSQYYDRIYNRHWNGLTIISNSIGQGEITLTPLQIANLGATIANRGYYMTPHVVKGIEGYDIDTAYTERHHTDIDRSCYEIVVQGMREAVLTGTCRAANRPEYQACGKTGTAQNMGKDHSAFMGFAPMDNPQIAVAVYVENGGFGAAFGVPIGSLIMEQYINGFLSEESLKKADELEAKTIEYDESQR